MLKSIPQQRMIRWKQQTTTFPMIQCRSNNGRINSCSRIKSFTTTQLPYASSSFSSSLQHLLLSTLEQNSVVHQRYPTATPLCMRSCYHQYSTCYLSSLSSSSTSSSSSSPPMLLLLSSVPKKKSSRGMMRSCGRVVGTTTTRTVTTTGTTSSTPNVNNSNNNNNNNRRKKRDGGTKFLAQRLAYDTLDQLEKNQQPTTMNNLQQSQVVASSSSSSLSSSTSSTSLSSVVPPSTPDDVQIQYNHRLDVAIVGLPNAGKSQLLNVLTEAHVAAVSSKRHTTRIANILGARTIYPKLNPTGGVDSPGTDLCTIQAALEKSRKQLELDNMIQKIKKKLKEEEVNQNRNNDTSNSNVEHEEEYSRTNMFRCTVPTQLLFVDTPGYIRQEEAKLEGLGDRQNLILSSKMATENVDYTLLVVDATKALTQPVKETFIELMLQALQSKGRDEFDEDDDDDDELDDDDDVKLEIRDYFTPEEKKALSIDNHETVDDGDNDDEDDDSDDDDSISDDDNSDEDDDNDDVLTTTKSGRNVLHSILDHQPNLFREKFAVVLNKVDLVQPKSDLLDIAAEIGELAEHCIRFHYSGGKVGGRSSGAINDTKVDSNNSTNMSNSSTPLTNGGSSENDSAIMVPDVDDKLLESNMPTFFYVSALQAEKTKNRGTDGDEDEDQSGIDGIVQHLLDFSTPSKSWEVEAGQQTTRSAEELIEETIREKLYRCLHNEIPYHVEQLNRSLEVLGPKSYQIYMQKKNQHKNKGSSSSSNSSTSNDTTTTTATTPSSNARAPYKVNNELFDKLPGVVIHQDLVVRTKSHQTIVNGTGKRTLERIRLTAERDLSRKVLKCHVSLTLHVRLIKSKNRPSFNDGDIKINPLKGNQTMEYNALLAENREPALLPPPPQTFIQQKEEQQLLLSKTTTTTPITNTIPHVIPTLTTDEESSRSKFMSRMKMSKDRSTNAKTTPENTKPKTRRKTWTIL